MFIIEVVNLIAVTTLSLMFGLHCW